jgi:hypothetical protein
MEMSDRRHQIEDLYHAALERPASQRAAFFLGNSVPFSALLKSVYRDTGIQLRISRVVPSDLWLDSK